jgi:hypothetical protein
VCLASAGQVHRQVAALLPAVEPHTRGAQHVHTLQSVVAAARQGAERECRREHWQASHDELRLLVRLNGSRNGDVIGRVDLDLHFASK